MPPGGGTLDEGRAPSARSANPLVAWAFAASEEFLGLLNDSCVGDLLRTEMGPFTPAMACQVAVTPPSPSPNPGTGPWPQYGNP